MRIAPVGLALALATPWNVWLPYLAGVVTLLVGLGTFLQNRSSRDPDDPPGVSTLIALGPLFIAIPIAVFGAEHFTATRFVVQMVPAWIPGHLFWVLFVGVALLCAALSIASGVLAGLAAACFGVMILLFEMLLHIPGIVAAPANRFIWVVALRDLAFSGGALALAATKTDVWRKNGRHAVLHFARFFVGVPIVVFGVLQFLHPEYVPAVPLNRQTPAWIPAHLLWTYPTATVYVIAGTLLLINQRARQAALWLALMILLITLAVYLPIMIAQPSDIGNGLNYFADTMLFAGSALVLAGALRGKESRLAHDGVRKVFPGAVTS
jgi:uncharacterized membrane protein